METQTSKPSRLCASIMAVPAQSGVFLRTQLRRTSQATGLRNRSPVKKERVSTAALWICPISLWSGLAPRMSSVLTKRPKTQCPLCRRLTTGDAPIADRFLRTFSARRLEC